jgi:hypothetical protein
VRRQLAALVAAVALAAGAIVALDPQPTALATVHTERVCVWADELRDKLDELSEDPADWIEVTWSSDHWGKAYPQGTGMGATSPKIPCDTVPSVVYLEWVHLQQYRHYGPDFGASVLGQDRVEIVADCGAWLLGLELHPVSPATARRARRRLHRSGFGYRPRADRVEQRNAAPNE